MKPLQVWLPTFDPALAGSMTRFDLERAQLSWTDQLTVWIRPGLEKKKVWPAPDHPLGFECAVPGEHLNRIDVFHICQNGYVSGRQSCHRFPGQRVDELLAEWLNVGPKNSKTGVRHTPVLSPNVSFRAPDFYQGKIGYRSITIQAFQPLGTMPAKIIESSGRSSADSQFELQASWPPEGENRGLTISPTAESEHRYGPWDTVFLEYEGKSIPTLISKQNSKLRSGLWRDVWPGNLQRFFPYGGGLDAASANNSMREVAEMSTKDPERALAIARDRSTRYLSQGCTTVWNAWFLPRLLEQSLEDALASVELRYDLDFRSLKEASASAEFKRRMGEVVETRRALGVLGLFWALLIEQLENGHSFQRCEWCRRLVRGRADKRFCNKQDNPDCWRKRRSAKRRHQRAKSKNRK